MGHYVQTVGQRWDPRHPYFLKPFFRQQSTTPLSKIAYTSMQAYSPCVRISNPLVCRFIGFSAPYFRFAATPHVSSPDLPLLAQDDLFILSLVQKL
jgi:hypothetical protein